MTIVATLKRHYCATGGTVAAQAALLRHRQQHRNVLDHLTEAKDAASWGRQAPSLLPRRCATIAAQAALLRQRLWSLGRVLEPLFSERLLIV